MPRLPRVYIENILYYVTSKGGHGQNIFTDSSDYKEYISLIDEYKKQYNFKLFSYVLLPAHIHMLIELKNNVGISNIMHDINSRYTKTFNNRYNKKGHLFQERFKALLAEKESCLLPLVRYIHLNPKTSGIVDEVRDYAYSSHQLFINPEKRQHPDIRNEIEEVFNMLEGREDAFREYVENAEGKELNEFKKSLRKRRILGSEDFEETIKKIIEKAARESKVTPLQKRARILYIVAGGVLIFVLSISVIYFYRQHKTLSSVKTEYDEAIALYTTTLETLEHERDNALQAKKDAEKYMWKIRLTEKSLERLKMEREEAIRAGREIEGYMWSIELKQIGGPKVAFLDSDRIYFEDNRISSTNLIKQGFSGSKYSKRELKDGRINWETIQMNERGGTANWRGEWDGKIMKGILRRAFNDGRVVDFSFRNSSERIKKGGLK
ncbi:transposase [Candidatus Omnitrophota bacterium]